MISVAATEGHVSFEPTQNFTVIDDRVNEVPLRHSVRPTTRTSLRFDGNDSVTSSAGQGLTNGSFAVCASGALSSEANPNATYDLFAYQNATVLIQYDAGQWRGYYNSTNASATVTLPVDSSGGVFDFLGSDTNDAFTRVCLRHNETANTISLSRGTTVSGPVELDGDVEPRNVSVNWRGRIDENRLFGNAPSNATLKAYGEDPVQAFPAETRLLSGRRSAMRRGSVRRRTLQATNLFKTVILRRP